MFAIQCEHLARHDAKFLELDEKFIASEDCVLELGLSLSIAALTEAMFCFQVTTLQTDLADMRVDHTGACSAGLSEHFELIPLRTDNDRLEPRVAGLTATVDDMCIQLTN